MYFRLFLFLFFSSITYANLTHTYLPNGLEVILKPDHRAPVAVVMMWYHVGSGDDPSGRTGLSHVLEHLMFKGTTTYPKNTFSKTVAALGGQENAFTTQDYTAYFVRISTQHLGPILKLEADRMQHLTLNESLFKKEMRVIQEERRMRIEDNPHALAFERFLAAAHLTSPYHQPIIGWMHDLKQLTLEDVKAWYQAHYAPNHATLVIVGDISPENLMPEIKQYFAPLQPKPLLVHKKQKEPPHLGPKVIKLSTSHHMPLLIQGYTVPSVKSVHPSHAADPYALELIATLLTTGDHSRLQQHLVQKTHCAHDVQVMYNLYTRYETQFSFFIIPTETCTLHTLHKSIDLDLETLKTTPVSLDELNTAKTQLIAQKTFEKDSLLGQASELGLLATQGLLESMDQYTLRLKQVTPQQIQNTAKKYFIRKALTEAQLTVNHGAHP